MKSINSKNTWMYWAKSDTGLTLILMLLIFAVFPMTFIAGLVYLLFFAWSLLLWVGPWLLAFWCLLRLTVYLARHIEQKRKSADFF